MFEFVVKQLLFHYSYFLTYQGNENILVAAKDHNKKEIRRDSKTGFEKFEDYFDSDFDNTTLRSQNVTTTDDPREDTGNFPCLCPIQAQKIA